MAIEVLAYRHLIAKRSKSTLLEEVYDSFGKSIQQKSDSEPLFNSREIKNLTKSTTIE